MILFKSILNEKTASLLLYGEISDEGGDGKIASRDIVNEVMYMDGSYENLNIRINSIGGDVYPGIARSMSASRLDIDQFHSFDEGGAGGLWNRHIAGANGKKKTEAGRIM